MSIPSIGAYGASAANPQSNTQRPPSPAASGGGGGGGSSAEETFLKYMKETPAERMEDTWLAGHHLTREGLKALPPQQRDAIMKQMAREIGNKVRQDALDKANDKMKTPGGGVPA